MSSRWWMPAAGARGTSARSARRAASSTAICLVLPALAPASLSLNDQVPALRILAIHAGMHDSCAAAFDDYQMVAAVSEERLTRVKGSGEQVPWLSIDWVLRIAG